MNSTQTGNPDTVTLTRREYTDLLEKIMRLERELEAAQLEVLVNAPYANLLIELN